MNINFNPILSVFKPISRVVTNHPVKAVMVAVAAIAVFSAAIYKLVQHHRKVKAKKVVNLSSTTNNQPATSTIAPVETSKANTSETSTKYPIKPNRTPPAIPTPPTESTSVPTTNPLENSEKKLTYPKIERRNSFSKLSTVKGNTASLAKLKKAVSYGDLNLVK